MGQRIENSEVPAQDLLCPTNGGDAIHRRLRDIDCDHVAPLNNWVRSLRTRPVLPKAAAATIPWFDPISAGIDARVLLLLQDPSGTAATTGFISPDNNDPSARCTTLACREAGLPRDIRLHWNVYPWWVNVPGGSKKKGGALPDPSRPPESWAHGSSSAAQLTGELFGLLPKLRVVVVLGVQAQKGFHAVQTAGLRLPTDVKLIFGPSLSPPGFYSHRPEAIALLREASNLAAREQRYIN